MTRYYICNLSLFYQVNIGMNPNCLFYVNYMLRIFGLILLSQLILSACGYKGPLYMPQDPPAHHHTQENL
ncbi:hypothetical protein Nstercoris_01059 [Nitrosomonas stercoris]|uniref:Lipoprotein n=1 Tax=Nitrosomonas stercoris TaxID=1444684 RepID=A0A4Y1YLA2_9PROT|nr:hypothetical protein Nstercoris_01059 [Nitrosomonas stercoris]